MPKKGRRCARQSRRTGPSCSAQSGEAKAGAANILSNCLQIVRSAPHLAYVDLYVAALACGCRRVH